jgi:DNA-directed RNA polymerase subunit K/omega
MVKRPLHMGRFEFAVVCGLRAAQLSRGCIALVPAGHKLTTTAQMEVAEAKIVRDPEHLVVVP